MIFLRALRLTAILLACVGLASPACAQGFDLFHRQSSQAAPPADIPNEAGADAGEGARARPAHQSARGAAKAGERPDRGTGEQRAPTRGSAAEVPAGCRVPLRRAVRPTRAAGSRNCSASGGARSRDRGVRRGKAEKVGRIRPRRHAERTGRAATARNDSCRARPSSVPRRRPPGLRSNSARPRRQRLPPPPRPGL